MTASEYEVDTDGLGTVLSYWWVWGETPWQALARLLQTQGPPSVYFEDGEGKVVVRGTGWPSADTDPAIVIGGALGLAVGG